MYEEFFQFSRRPFGASPDVERYYPARAVEAARRTLVRCIERAEGVGILIGPSGTGKTLVCRLLEQHFQASFAVAHLGSGRLGTPRALLQAILFAASLPYRDREDGELRLSLIDFLANSEASRAGLLLLVDEAHTLPARVLEEIRQITNVIRDGQPRVRLIMAGGQSLEERLASPKLESFSQRIAARCYLEPLDRGETGDYLSAQIASAGADPRELLAADVAESVYRATDGVPRLVNQVCDHALILAFANGAERISGADIEAAWADLQQLPTPWSEGPGEATGDVIQFGRLDDELDDGDPRASELHVAAEFDGAAAGPSAQLDEIEEQLASIDVDGRPTYSTSIAATAEGASCNPFGEVFAEEEVLVDRFGTAHRAAWEQRPQVYSAEGRLLSSLLQPFVQVTKSPQLSISATGASGVSSAGHNRAWTVAPAPSHGVEVAPGVAVQGHDWQAFADDSLIVVEDDPTVPHASRDLSPRVHRQEYSQLFAKLRRG